MDPFAALADPVRRELLRALAHAGSYVVGAYAGTRMVGASAGFFTAPPDPALRARLEGLSLQELRDILTDTALALFTSVKPEEES